MFTSELLESIKLSGVNSIRICRFWGGPKGSLSLDCFMRLCPGLSPL